VISAPAGKESSSVCGFAWVGARLGALLTGFGGADGDSLGSAGRSGSA
jgi:hypothetical protein